MSAKKADKSPRRQVNLDADNFIHYTEKARKESRTLPRQVNHTLRVVAEEEKRGAK